jgi:hypothetical protein
MKKFHGTLILVSILLPFSHLPGTGPAAACPCLTHHIILLAVPRHGISFFPRVQHPGVEYTPGDTLSFDRYHTYAVICHWMTRWAEEHPEIVSLYEIARSYEGRPIMQMTLTSTKNGTDTDKPAAFFEGNRHSGEITSAESVLWLARHLIEGYGNDPAITDLLDHFTVYLGRSTILTATKCT